MLGTELSPSLLMHYDSSESLQMYVSMYILFIDKLLLYSLRPVEEMSKTYNSRKYPSNVINIQIHSEHISLTAQLITLNSTRILPDEL